MKIAKWDINNQICKLGKNEYSVDRLKELSKEFEVFDAPIDCLNVYNTYDKLSLREMVMHIQAVLDCDLTYPIILDEDGEIMDGRHRIMKAILNGDKTIKAVRFDKNPLPCRRDE